MCDLSDIVFRKSLSLATLLAAALILSNCESPVTPDYTGKASEKITLTFVGPEVSEQGDPNPFLDYRLNVTFRLGDRTMVVPGFFAADGNAAESSAESGSTWKVHFRPSVSGDWTYKVSLRSGKDIAVNDDAMAGEAIEGDGTNGIVAVSAADAGARGRLKYVGERYEQFEGTGEYFLKGGADSPENFLAFADFDGTYRYAIESSDGEATAEDVLHQYEPHLQDWKPSDPTWQDGKGKAMIGALNYLAGKGMNVVYMLTMNIEGDGKDVWPYISHEEFRRFDCSKLAQWEIVFDHMDKLGLMVHIITQETENELLLDEGNTSFDRKLYYRELIARFAHHPMLTWNMGEENGPASFTPNGQDTKQREDMIAFFQKYDPYNNLVVIHSHSVAEHRDHLFKPHLGNKDLEGMSMQVSDKNNIHEVTKYWVAASSEAGQPWVMNMDEIGRHYRGADHDARPDNNQDSCRRDALWGNLMAGGAGGEWYFGYRNPHNDLGCEDWRSRDRLWDYTRYALEFFQTQLPFPEMNTHDELIEGGDNYCFARPGEIYAIYLKYGGQTNLDLSGNSGAFELQWYNPRTGGALSSAKDLAAGEQVQIGPPPSDGGEDWVALIRLKN